MELYLRPEQSEVFRSLNRFNVLLAHRRFGKTVLAIALLGHKAQECTRHRPQVHYYCPSYSQAKRVAWAYVKDYFEPTGAEFNESELKCTFPNGSILQLGSAENPDASRGIYSDFCVLDEPSDMPTRMWTEVLRPALSDRNGGALMIGTPKGRHGLFFDSYQAAAEDPLWWRGMYKASDTDIVAEEELQAAQRVMSRAEYLQEYECDWSAAIRGAYYGERMNEIEDQITRVPHDDTLQVHCAFDLGMNDETAIWYFQLHGQEIRCIEYEEHTGTGLPDMLRHIKSKPYNYGPFVFPHDVNVRSLSTGKTRKHTLEQLGVEVIVAPKLPIIDGIEATRSFLRNCWFDERNCNAGIEALRQYRSDYNEKNGVLRLTPLHDWSSHGADSMRYLATTPLSYLDQWSGELVYADTGRV